MPAGPQEAAILEVLHSERFVDQPPAEVYATLLEEGVFLASPRTMYRVLAAAKETQERRAQRAPRSFPTPCLAASAPNQVWTWDISKLPKFTAGVFLSLYAIRTQTTPVAKGRAQRWVLRECARAGSA